MNEYTKHMHQINEKIITFLPWESIELEAQEQIKNTAQVPCLFKHVAVMPDCHFGKGATVGTVLATKGAIIPAAVGVDIGCVDADTEYLSPMGWKRIADYDGGMVMQFNHSQGKFVKPVAYIKRKQEKFLHFKTKYGVDQMLTPDHRMLVYRPSKKTVTGYVEEVVLAGQLAAEHTRLKLGSRVKIPVSFGVDIVGKIKLTDAQIRVQVMVMADGHIEKNQCILRLKKVRKKNRAEDLLNTAKISYSMSEPDDDGVVTFRFIPPLKDKTYQLNFWSASYSQLLVIVDEVFQWDGSIDDSCFYTRDKDSADFISYAFAATGHRSVMRADKHYRDGKTDYRVYAYSSYVVGIAGTPKSPIREVKSSDGFAYCFTVPSGFLVLRRSGNVFVTGNCGMIAVKTNLKRDDIKDLAKIREGLERRIPMSAGKFNSKITESAQKKIDQLEELAAHDNYDGKLFYDAISPNWREQLGTLGGGNHFIELCVDEEDTIWATLHSGSRGVGNKIGNLYIETAQDLMKKYLINLPDKDLAYLPEETPEFAAYCTRLAWAQEFARLNRDEMMDRFLTELSYSIYGEDGHQNEFEVERINCHHNFTQMESHFGHNVWVTRKGAVQAREGMKAMIPGSMGTRSYIVSGLGNKMSFESSPHGAGRRMSRKKASEQYTMEDLEKAMEGIEFRRSNVLIDEIPGAYKDVEEVMENASELVKIEHTLKQILNCKGD